MVESSHSKALLENTSVLLDIVKSKRHSSDNVAQNILISNKIANISKALNDLSTEWEMDVAEKIEIFNRFQSKLDTLLKYLDYGGLHWLEIVGMIQFVNQVKASIYFYDERKKISSTAQLLADILMKTIIVDNLPKIPDPSHKDFRKVSAIVINYLVNTAGIYEITISNLQIIEENSLMEWLEIIFDTYYKMFQIIDNMDWDELILIYKKSKSIKVLIENEIVTLFSYDQLGSLLYFLETAKVKNLYDHHLFKYLEVRNYNDYLEYTLKRYNATKGKIDTEILKDVSLKSTDIELLFDLELVMNITSLRKNYYELLENQANGKSYSDFVSDLYGILESIRSGLEINAEFLRLEIGQSYLSYLEEFLALFALEALELKSYFVFQERIKAIQDLFDILFPQEYPILFQKYYLIRIFMDLEFNLTENLKSYFQKLWIFRDELEINYQAFVENVILSSLLGYYTDLLTNEQIETILEDTMNVINESIPDKRYLNDFESYSKEIIKAINGKEYSFDGICEERMEIHKLDEGTWLLPKFEKLANEEKVVIPYISFNRVQDKICRV